MWASVKQLVGGTPAVPTFFPESKVAVSAEGGLPVPHQLQVGGNDWRKGAAPLRSACHRPPQGQEATWA